VARRMREPSLRMTMAMSGKTTRATMEMRQSSVKATMMATRPLVESATALLRSVEKPVERFHESTMMRLTTSVGPVLTTPRSGRRRTRPKTSRRMSARLRLTTVSDRKTCPKLATAPMTVRRPRSEKRRTGAVILPSGSDWARLSGIWIPQAESFWFQPATAWVKVAGAGLSLSPRTSSRMGLRPRRPAPREPAERSARVMAPASVPG